MTTFVEINDVRYPAVITGRMSDKDWDGRETKSIKLEMTYAEAVALFVDDVAWNVVQEQTVQHNETDENGKVYVVEEVESEVFDNSEFCIAGSVTDMRDGTMVVKMGKYTVEEQLLMEVLG